MFRNAIRTTTYVAAIAAGLLAVRTVQAGPLPLDVLRQMYSEVTAGIQNFEARLATLAVEIKAEKNNILKLQTIASFASERDYANAVGAALTHLSDLEREYARIQSDLSVLRQRLDWIVAQIEQWKQMTAEPRKTGSSPPAPTPRKPVGVRRLTSSGR